MEFFFQNAPTVANQDEEEKAPIQWYGMDFSGISDAYSSSSGVLSEPASTESIWSSPALNEWVDLAPTSRCSLF